jgi:hypothetical protein
LPYSVSTASSLTNAICSRLVDRFDGGQDRGAIFPRHKRQGSYGCTIQVRTTVSGKTVVIASGKPLDAVHGGSWGSAVKEANSERKPIRECSDINSPTHRFSATNVLSVSSKSEHRIFFSGADAAESHNMMLRAAALKHGRMRLEDLPLVRSSYPTASLQIWEDPAATPEGKSLIQDRQEVA